MYVLLKKLIQTINEISKSLTIPTKFSIISSYSPT